jgi:hypothetical protein
LGSVNIEQIERRTREMRRKMERDHKHLVAAGILSSFHHQALRA